MFDFEGFETEIDEAGKRRRYVEKNRSYGFSATIPHNTRLTELSNRLMLPEMEKSHETNPWKYYASYLNRLRLYDINDRPGQARVGEYSLDERKKSNLCKVEDRAVPKYMDNLVLHIHAIERNGKITSIWLSSLI